ncbi:MAG: glycosyltransferase, partial [Bacteroidales bacterium]|nr:glycosyltransferase [Bacteroidales bacterium]
MLTLKIIFWVFLFIIFYTYLGYGIVLYMLVRIKRLFKKPKPVNTDYEPEVTLFVAAYNEKDYVNEKVANSLSLEYPKEKLKQVWVTDGSDDGTPEILKKYTNQGIEVCHEDARGGKIGAMNRGMAFVKTPIVIFSDGNTSLG